MSEAESKAAFAIIRYNFRTYESGGVMAVIKGRGNDREFFPLAGRGKAIEVEQGSAVHDGATDLDHAAEANQVLVVDLMHAI